jgi:hypothetical protein
LESELRAIADSRAPPTGLIVTYDDRHGLWGGVRITVVGDGQIEKSSRPCGTAEFSVQRAVVSWERLIELARLLVEFGAWEQVTPESPPIPDESRASLTIHVNGHTTHVWERFNEMKANARLILIREFLDSLTDA